MFLELRGLTKRYGDTCAVDRLDLDVEEGTICCLLGPSGCGKTTTLRMVGGYLEPTAGSVALDGRDITGLPPEDRPVSTVFQSYGLFPHLTVVENVAYGLACRKVPAPERRRQALEMLAAVHLEGHADSSIQELSGGQQQRVALARSLVLRPQLLLLDEPLSNLDAALRLQMRDEIRRIQRSFGITTLFVTHDQEEAMAIGDTVALMDGGRLRQHATPEEAYLRPADAWCASFLGHVNELDGAAGPVRFREQDAVPAADGRRSGTVTEATFLGAQRLYRIDVGGQEVLMRCRDTDVFPVGTEVRFNIVRTITW